MKNTDPMTPSPAPDLALEDLGLTDQDMADFAHGSRVLFGSEKNPVAQTTHPTKLSQIMVTSHPSNVEKKQRTLDTEHQPDQFKSSVNTPLAPLGKKSLK